MELSDRDFNLIRDIIYENTGIRLKDSKRMLVVNRLRKRVQSLGLSGFAPYCRLMREKEGLKRELGELIDYITTNETYFFREIRHFDVLNQEIFPEAGRHPGKTLSVWCAGCATGQEPYSVAIAALEYMSAHNVRFPVSILGTDVSVTALNTARKGIYPKNKMRTLTPQQISRFFDAVEEGWQVKKALRFHVRFDYLNLVHERPSTRFDVIFCRNVMIYFDQASQAKTIANLRESLRPGGSLFIGHAETLYNNLDGFDMKRVAGATVYRKQFAAKEQPIQIPIQPALNAWRHQSEIPKM